MAQESYKLGETRFAIRTTSGAFCQWLQATLGSYGVRAEENDFAHYSVVVAGGEDPESDRGGKKFHILYRGTTALVRSLHLATVARALLGELETFSFRERDDAIYLNCGVIASNGTTGLATSSFLAPVGKLGRRVERAGVRLPGSTTVAVEPASGRVVPVSRSLDIDDQGAMARLQELLPGDGGVDRVFVEEPISPDVVFTLVGGEMMLQPASRAQTLHRLAASVHNLPKVGREALRGLSQLVERARCYGLGSGDARGMLDALSRGMGADGR